MMVIKIAYRNLLRHMRQSLITGSSVAFGFAGVLLLGAYMLRMERYLVTQGVYLNHVGHVSIYKNLDRHLVDPNASSFSTAELRTINLDLASDPDVEFTGSFLHGQGMITNGCRALPFLTWASESKLEQRLHRHPQVLEHTPELVRMRSGRGFWDVDPSDAVTVTPTIARLLHKPIWLGEASDDVKARDQLITNCDSPSADEQIAKHSGVQLLGTTFDGGLAAADASISGQISTGFSLTEDNSIWLPLPFAQRFFSTDRVTSVAVFLKDTLQTSRFEKRLRTMAAEWKFPVEIYRYDDFRVNPFYVGAMRFVYMMNLFFLVLVCGVVILSLLNSINISLLERKSEVGTMLALGISKNWVIRLFVVELLFLTAAGMVVGTVIAMAIAIFVNSLNIRFDIVGDSEKLQLLLKPELWFGTVVFVLFLFISWIASRVICWLRMRQPMVQLLEAAP